MTRGKTGLLGGLARSGIVASGLLLGAANAMADPITLTLSDENSTATVCVFDCGTVGMNSWVVDGVERLYQQWFFYRFEPGPSHSIDTIDSTPYTTGGGGSTGSVEYSNGSIGIKVDFTLSGGDAGSHKSSLKEEVTLKHLFGPTAYPTIDLYQYSNFDLCGPGSHDTIDITDGVAVQTSSCDGVTSTTTVSQHSYYEAGGNPSTLNHITAGDNLNNNPSVTGVDATSAFQWSVYLLPNGLYWDPPDNTVPGDVAKLTITKDLAPVPEPMSMLLLVTGLLGASRYAVKRRRAGAQI